MWSWTPKGGPGLVERPVEAIEVDAVGSLVNELSKLLDQALVSRRQQPALEDRILDANPVPFTSMRDAGQAACSDPGGRVNIVRYQDVHGHVGQM